MQNIDIVAYHWQFCNLFGTGDAKSRRNNETGDAHHLSE